MNEVTKAEIRKRLGNISLLRELLLGDKIDEYDRKLEQYQLKLDNLELNLQHSQTATNQSIARLESKMLQRMDAIAKILVDRTKYHRLETKVIRISYSRNSTIWQTIVMIISICSKRALIPILIV